MPDSVTGCRPSLYDAVSKSELPKAAVLASLGCGNLTTLAEPKQGEVVLDLGSGGGIDVLLSGKRRPYRQGVWPRHDARDAGLAGRTLLPSARPMSSSSRGTSRRFHFPTIASTIISTCVINLSADKRQVLKEAFRVLKPGGRFAVSDVVVKGKVPAEMRRSLELWIGCVAGASEVAEFDALLRDVAPAPDGVSFLMTGRCSL